MDVVQGFLQGLGGLLLSFIRQQRSSLPLSAICTDTLVVCTELSVAEEAYPLTSPSSSDHWKILFDSSGEIALIEEDGEKSPRGGVNR